MFRMGAKPRRHKQATWAMLPLRMKSNDPPTKRESWYTTAVRTKLLNRPKVSHCTPLYRSKGMYDVSTYTMGVLPRHQEPIMYGIAIHHIRALAQA
jgi:hypothetical protein